MCSETSDDLVTESKTNCVYKFEKSNSIFYKNCWNNYTTNYKPTKHTVCHYKTCSCVKIPPIANARGHHYPVCLCVSACGAGQVWLVTRSQRCSEKLTPRGAIQPGRHGEKCSNLAQGTEQGPGWIIDRYHRLILAHFCWEWGGG